MDKPGSKGVCCYCDMRQINKTRLKMFETKAQEKLKKKSKKLEKINVEKKIEEKKMNKKVGLLQKANTLYK